MAHKYNDAKTKIFYILAIWSRNRDFNGRSARQLARDTGVPYSYLKSILNTWYRWGYLRRKVYTPSSGRPVFVYLLANKGLKFLNSRYETHVLALAREIREYRAKLRAGTTS